MPSSDAPRRAATISMRMEYRESRFPCVRLFCATFRSWTAGKAEESRSSARLRHRMSPRDRKRAMTNRCNDRQPRSLLSRINRGKVVTLV